MVFFTECRPLGICTIPSCYASPRRVRKAPAHIEPQMRQWLGESARGGRCAEEGERKKGDRLIVEAGGSARNGLPGLAQFPLEPCHPRFPDAIRARRWPQPGKAVG